MSKKEITDKWCDEDDYDSEDGEFGLDSQPIQKSAPKVYKKKEEEKVRPNSSLISVCV